MKRPRLGLLAGLFLAVAAVPRPGGAAGAPAGARQGRVSFAPLFDTKRAFKPKRTFKLRFRAKDRASGAALAPDQISFSLRHDASDVPLAARQLRSGVFEVPFSPGDPGLYLVAVRIRGQRDGSIAPVRLGVVGVAEGIIELPPEADTEVKPRGKAPGRFAR